MNSVAVPATMVFEEDVESSGLAETPIWSTPIGWILLLPLLFYSVNGGIITDSQPAKIAFSATQESTPIHRLILLSIAITAFALSLTRSRAMGATAMHNLPVFILPVITLASCSWSDAPLPTLVNSFFLIVQTVLALYLSVRLTRNQQLELLVFAGAVALLSSWLAVFVFPSVGVDGYQNNAWRGIFSRHNNCAAAALFFCISAYYYKTRSLAGVVLKYFVLGSGLVFVVMSESRTGWGLTVIALALGCAVSLLQLFSRHDRLTLLTVLLLLAGTSALCLYQYRDTVLTSVGKDATLDQRTLIWDITLQSALHNPWIGYGYTSFWHGISGPSELVALSTGWMAAQAQSGYIDLSLDLGGLGLASFALMIVAAMRNGIRAGRSTTGASSHFLRWCMVTVVIFLLYNIGESSIMGAYNLTWLIFVVAVFGMGKRDGDGSAAHDRAAINSGVAQ